MSWILGTAVGACVSSEGSGTGLVLRECRLRGVGLDAKCGELRVPENRRQGRGRQLALRVVVVPALALRPKRDPLFLLVGGPGQSASVSGAPIAALLQEVRAHRDIVLVDQRGTGQSGPLACPRRGSSLAQLFADDLDTVAVETCLRKLDADPSEYSTPVAMDDLDEVRSTLGYERINLWGASYGTRAALEYARRYRTHARRLVLDGPVPTDVKLPLYAGRDAQRALNLVFADCLKEAACARSFPGLEATFRQLLDELAREPRLAKVPHPRTGKPEEFTLDREAMASAIRLMLYSPPLAAMIPFAVTRATQGDYGPLVAAVATLADGVEQDLQYGLFLSVVCAEDVPRITSAEADVLTQGNFLGPSGLESMRRACQRWPVARLPDSYFAPVTEQAPTLILSGNLDPIVPPLWGDLVAERMPHSKHIVVDGVAHGVTQVGCFPDVIADFLESESPERIVAECAGRIERPPFVTSLTGGAP